jgi:hypothetical protein
MMSADDSSGPAEDGSTSGDDSPNDEVTGGRWTPPYEGRAQPDASPFAHLPPAPPLRPPPPGPYGYAQPYRPPPPRKRHRAIPIVVVTGVAVVWIAGVLSMGDPKPFPDHPKPSLSVPSTFAGTWIAIVHDMTRRNAERIAELRLTNGKAVADFEFPDSGCSEGANPVSYAAGRLTLHTIPRRRGTLCADGDVQVTVRPDGRLDFSFPDRDSGAIWSGILTRRR